MYFEPYFLYNEKYIAKDNKEIRRLCLILMDTINFSVAFLCGLIPALFWLWFWLREDKERPEPLLLIAITFIAGMAVVPLALPLQKAAIDMYSGNELYWFG